MGSLTNISKMVKGQRFVLKHQFNGLPKKEDFDLIEEDLPPLKDGEILVSALYLSVDPYMRSYVGRMNPPFTMIGQNVSKVIESRHADYPVGCILVTNSGWIKTGILKPNEMLNNPQGLIKAPELPGLSPSLLLGACGMPGNTAFFGFLEICQPKSGDTVVVNGAAGAVGSLVGQIAKIKGCTVIGFAGTDEKCQLLTNKYGFDKAYNYKKISTIDALKEGAPNGVDCFFDNVGGEDSVTVINEMNKYGRISLCGAISTYNDKEVAKVSATDHSFIMKELKQEGFHVTRWGKPEVWTKGIKQMATWIHEGKIKVDETIVEGFEKMPEAFIGLLTGANIGKMIIKA